jgi:dTDP-4-dehydrorhamnose 3,5-epimerase
MSRFEFILTPINGLKIVKRTALGDSRGFFSRFYCADSFLSAGSALDISQINHTLTSETGVVRGMHFQLPPHAEVKFVSCLQGEIFDVAIDLRRDSPTFLQWFSTSLSAENQTSLLIPPGCAHGFQTLTENCEIIYLHSAAYEPSAEGAINALDPRIAINWPLPIKEMSQRDTQHPMIDLNYPGISL